MDNFPPGICNDRWRTIPRQQDGEAFYIHFTGGFRVAKANDNQWCIEPVLEEGEARTKGFVTKSQLEKIVRSFGFKALGFQEIGWINGVWHSSWRPIIPSEKSHILSPADLWGAISSNIFRAQRAQIMRGLEITNHKEFETFYDTGSLEERIAHAISSSLRSMDLAVEAIAEHYNEQLVNKMYRGEVCGQKSSNTIDQNLFAHVHSFFLQLGAARDYLATFIANRLGMNTSHGKIDTMNALRVSLEDRHNGKDPILEILIEKRWLVPPHEGTKKWTTSGWLKQISDLRNEIVHRRPYGAAYAERFGWVKPISPEHGIYRYFRPIKTNAQTDQDLLEVICDHYRTCTDLFFHAAKLSDLDYSTFNLTDKDIIL